MNMEHSTAQLMDLPDEIITIILKKLDNVEVLYSLMDINTRLNQILHDPIFTNKITLMTPTDHPLTLPDILPRIHHKIQWFSLESASIERILLAANYPSLRQLDIFIITEESELHLNLPIFQNQIVTLSISGGHEKHDKYEMNERADFLSHILTMFSNVHHLKFYQNMDSLNASILFHDQSSLFSSTLQELHVNVYLFDDCLYLLDGRLNQLCTLFINVFHILPLRSDINHKEKLLNLKYSSLTCRDGTFVYNQVLIPHLHRMSNLEKLTLNISIEGEEKFIDGNNLEKDIISHMPRLREFLFNIRSIVEFDNLMQLPSNEDIQRTLTSCSDHQVISYVDYFPSETKGQCHIYTYPHEMIFYDDITNSFPGGLFQYVQDVTLFDEHPFEHTFFLRIAQAFPLLRDLTVKNWKAQHRNFIDDNRHLPIIEYPRLARLCLREVHDDYAEQFLLNTKTCLSDYIWLMINYDTLQRVTDNFTRDTTRLNCLKIKKMHLLNRLNIPNHFYTYFPILK